MANVGTPNYRGIYRYSISQYNTALRDLTLSVKTNVVTVYNKQQNTEAFSHKPKVTVRRGLTEHGVTI